MGKGWRRYRWRCHRNGDTVNFSNPNLTLNPHQNSTKAAIEGWNSTPQHKRSVFNQDTPMSERKKSMVKAKALNFSTSKNSTPRREWNSGFGRGAAPNSPRTPRDVGEERKNMLRTLQMKMKVALYGDDVRSFFKRCDHEKSGTFDFQKLKPVCRKILKISTKDVSDEEIEKLVKLMDASGSGSVGIEDFAEFIEGGLIRGKPLEAINITAKKKKKKALYSWEVRDEDPEAVKLLKIRGRKTIESNKENFKPCDDEIGWYAKEGAQPEDYWVDFRIVMTEAEYKELEKRRRRWINEQKHKERFEKVHKNREAKMKQSSSRGSLLQSTPYVDKGIVEKSLLSKR